MSQQAETMNLMIWIPPQNPQSYSLICTRMPWHMCPQPDTHIVLENTTVTKIKKNIHLWAVVAQAFNCSSRRQKQADICELEACLVFTVSSRTGRVTQLFPVSEQANKQTNTPKPTNKVLAFPFKVTWDETLLDLCGLCEFFFCVILETGSHCEALAALNSLCRPSWPQTHRTNFCLGLKVCKTRLTTFF